MEHSLAEIEPIVRESIARLLPINDTDAHTIGSYWTRDGRTELDLVGINGQGAKRWVSFVGSIKWRKSKPFSGNDASKLAAQRALVPGTSESTTLVGVSSSGFDLRDIPITLDPSDLLNAWAPNRM